MRKRGDTRKRANIFRKRGEYMRIEEEKSRYEAEGEFVGTFVFNNKN